MSGETSSRHYWIPVLAAIITAAAAVIASYVGADAKRQVNQLEAQKKHLEESLLAAENQIRDLKDRLLAAQQELQKGPEPHELTSSGSGGRSQPVEKPEQRAHESRTQQLISDHALGWHGRARTAYLA